MNECFTSKVHDLASSTDPTTGTGSSVTLSLSHSSYKICTCIASLLAEGFGAILMEAAQSQLKLRIGTLLKYPSH